LKWKAASAKLVEKAVAHDSWPIHCDILYPPPTTTATVIEE